MVENIRKRGNSGDDKECFTRLSSVKASPTAATK